MACITVSKTDDWFINGNGFYALWEEVRKLAKTQTGINEEELDGFESVKGLDLTELEAEKQQQYAHLLHAAARNLSSKTTEAELKPLFENLKQLIEKTYPSLT